MRVSHALRVRRRAHAPLIAERLNSEVHRVRINDAKASHVTVWIEEDRRLEWWPATERWRCWNGKTHFGNALQLVRFVRAAAALAKEVA